jgi:hypothetical protein
MTGSRYLQPVFQSFFLVWSPLSLPLPLLSPEAAHSDCLWRLPTV